MGSYKHIRPEPSGDNQVIRFVHSQLFETLLLSEVDRELSNFVANERPRHLVFDFEGVEYCSTSLINILLRVRREVAEGDGSLALCNLRQTVRDAFRMLNLEGHVFSIFDTLDDALAASIE